MTRHEHPSQNIIDLCQAALDSVRQRLGARHHAHASEFASVYDEWLPGLEFAIDCLVENECAVSPPEYDAFERASRAMSRTNDDRLRHLRELVSAPQR